MGEEDEGVARTNERTNDGHDNDEEEVQDVDIAHLVLLLLLPRLDS